MTVNSTITADRLQDYLAGRLSAADHRRVERAMAHEPGAVHLVDLLRDTAALLRQGAPGGRDIPADWIELLKRRARDNRRTSGGAKH